MVLRMNGLCRWNWESERAAPTTRANAELVLQLCISQGVTRERGWSFRQILEQVHLEGGSHITPWELMIILSLRSDQHKSTTVFYPNSNNGKNLFHPSTNAYQNLQKVRFAGPPLPPKETDHVPEDFPRTMLFLDSDRGWAQAQVDEFTQLFSFLRNPHKQILAALQKIQDHLLKHPMPFSMWHPEASFTIFGPHSSPFRRNSGFLSGFFEVGATATMSPLPPDTFTQLMERMEECLRSRE